MRFINLRMSLHVKCLHEADKLVMVEVNPIELVCLFHVIVNGGRFISLFNERLQFQIGTDE